MTCAIPNEFWGQVNSAWCATPWDHICRLYDFMLCCITAFIVFTVVQPHIEPFVLCCIITHSTAVCDFQLNDVIPLCACFISPLSPHSLWMGNFNVKHCTYLFIEKLSCTFKNVVRNCTDFLSSNKKLKIGCSCKVYAS